MTLKRMASMALLAALAGCQSMPWQKEDPNAPVVDANGVVTPAPIVTDTSAPAADPMQPMSPVAPEGLALATTNRFPDVPLPVGVKEDLDRSYVYESHGFRVGRMVYTSKESLQELAQFFIRECPIADWKLNSTVQAEGIQLQFLKPTESLDVSVHSPGVGRAKVLILHLKPIEAAGAY